MSSQTTSHSHRAGGLPDALLDGTILGEGVIVDSRPVSFAVRLVGGLIDAVVTYAVLWLLSMGVAMLSSVGAFQVDPKMAIALQLGAVVLVLVGGPVTVETLTRGRSIGKLVMGVRIVRDDGGPIRFRHALIRGLTAIFELWMTAGGLAVIVSFFNSKGKRIGDLLAGTYATRVRSAKVRQVPLWMPPHLGTWGASADIRPLPDGYALAARQFLMRAPMLAPESRTRLAIQIAGLLEPYAAPGPPLGTHPEEFIQALLAARRDRDMNFALTQESRSRALHSRLQRVPFNLD